MNIKKTVEINQVLFNTGKHLFTSEPELATWKKDWLSKGNIITASNDIVEVVYSNEQEEQDAFRNYSCKDFECSFVYYKKVLTEPRVDWDEKCGSVVQGVSDREVITIVKDLNEVRALIERDIREGAGYIDQVKVLLGGELLPFNIILKNIQGEERVFTMASLSCYDIKVAEDESIYLDFNMYEMEREGRVTYCYRDEYFAAMNKDMSNEYKLANPVRVIKNRLEV